MPYSSVVNLGMDKVIDKVNAKFHEYLRQGLIFKMFDRQTHARIEQDYIPKSLPMKRCIWNRGVTQDDPPVIEYAQKVMFICMVMMEVGKPKQSIKSLWLI